MPNNRKGMLVIVEGWGERGADRHGALSRARTPNWDRLSENFAAGTLGAAGDAVGLSGDVPGNPEAGTMTIASGRPVLQPYNRVERAIENGTLFENPVLIELASTIRAQQRGTLHVVALLSDARVHGDLRHLFALLQFAKREQLKQVAVHAILDGRDTAAVLGLPLLRRVGAFCEDLGVGRIETVQGRFYAMDRDLQWARTQRAYEAIVAGRASAEFTRATDYLGACYEYPLTDEFIPPGVRAGYPGIKDGDAVVFAHFNGERVAQLVSAMSDVDFPHFRRANLPAFSGFATLFDYGAGRANPVLPGPEHGSTLGGIVAGLGWEQLRIAEHEGYERVTRAFNCGAREPFDGEQRVCVPGERVSGFDAAPEMAAEAVVERALSAFADPKIRFGVVGFPNIDIVAHTGNLPATVRAVERVDACLGKLMDWIEAHDAFAVITSNTGNCELMRHLDGAPHVSHTASRVPCVVVDRRARRRPLAADATLSDVAPTFLDLWEIDASGRGMSGRSLILP